MISFHQTLHSAILWLVVGLCLIWVPVAAQVFQPEALSGETRETATEDYLRGLEAHYLQRYQAALPEGPEADWSAEARERAKWELGLLNASWQAAGLELAVEHGVPAPEAHAEILARQLDNPLAELWRDDLTYRGRNDLLDDRLPEALEDAEDNSAFVALSRRIWNRSNDIRNNRDPDRPRYDTAGQARARRFGDLAEEVSRRIVFGETIIFYRPEPPSELLAGIQKEQREQLEGVPGWRYFAGEGIGDSTRRRAAKARDLAELEPRHRFQRHLVDLANRAIAAYAREHYPEAVAELME